MLEILKSQVLVAYQELNSCGLDKYSRGIVSAINREAGLIAVKSANDMLVADLLGNILEGNDAAASDIQSHIEIYQAFPKLGGIARPHARYATIFAQVGMEIPVLGSFHKDLFRVKIPCANSTADVGDVFNNRKMDPLLTPAALITSHSAYAWGKTALEAVVNAAALEETAYLAYQTMQLDPGIQPIK